MKKYIYIILAIIAISLCGCIATTDDFFPIRSFNGPRLMLVNYPALKYYTYDKNCLIEHIKKRELSNVNIQ